MDEYVPPEYDPDEEDPFLGDKPPLDLKAMAQDNAEDSRVSGKGKKSHALD